MSDLAKHMALLHQATHLINKGVRELNDQIARLRAERDELAAALLDIATSPRIEPRDNAAVARAALARLEPEGP